MTTTGANSISVPSSVVPNDPPVEPKSRLMLRGFSVASNERLNDVQCGRQSEMKKSFAPVNPWAITALLLGMVLGTQAQGAPTTYTVNETITGPLNGTAGNPAQTDSVIGAIIDGANNRVSLSRISSSPIERTGDGFIDRIRCGGALRLRSKHHAQKQCRDCPWIDWCE